MGDDRSYMLFSSTMVLNHGRPYVPTRDERIFKKMVLNQFSYGVDDFLPLLLRTIDMNFQQRLCSRGNYGGPTAAGLNLQSENRIKKTHYQ